MLSRRGRVCFFALSISLAHLVVDILVHGPLTQLDRWVYQWDGQQTHPQWDSLARAYDKLGQRSVLVPILLVVAVPLARRHRTWRPVVLALVSFLILNVVVGAMKLLIGRSETETGSPDVLSGGIIFPSGHSSNMVLTGGLIIYLLIKYSERRPVRRLVALVTLLTSITVLTSIYLRSHWVSDLIGGMLVGGLLLQAVIVFDRATAVVPADAPPLIAWPARKLGLLEGQRDGVDVVPVAGRGRGAVAEDVIEVGLTPTTTDLRAP
jgi:membrane-associated phospholipid phosphatase